MDVVATAGAGDAFAAGFLSRALRGLLVGKRLRNGRLLAAATPTVSDDLAPPPSRGHADRPSDPGDEAWGRLRLGHARTPAGAAKEVITP